MVGKQRRPITVTACTFERRDGRPCGATPLKGKAVCFWHDPEHEQEAADARRLGGLRRRREKTVASAYDFAGLGSVEAIRRIVEIAVLDALGLENSIARNRVLISATVAAARLLEAEELASFRSELEEG